MWFPSFAMIQSEWQLPSICDSTKTKAIRTFPPDCLGMKRYQ